MTDTRNKLYSETVSAGSRLYFFDVKESEEGTKYLIITESRKKEKEFDRNMIMVFEEYLDDFYEGLQSTLKFIGVESALSTIEKIRLSHPRAYTKWEAEEDQYLKLRFNAGTEIVTLAEIFERQPSAIRSRLQKLDLLEEE